MNLETVYQISIGITSLYLFFMSWNNRTKNLISFIVFKLTPFALALIIAVNAFVQAGYIVKV